MRSNLTTGLGGWPEPFGHASADHLGDEAERVEGPKEHGQILDQRVGPEAHNVEALRRVGANLGVEEDHARVALDNLVNQHERGQLLGEHAEEERRRRPADQRLVVDRHANGDLLGQLRDDESRVERRQRPAVAATSRFHRLAPGPAGDLRAPADRLMAK
jgi:hypothetical protein